MKINIIGGSGVVGNGIFSVLKKQYEIQNYDSRHFNLRDLKYDSDEVFDCDVFIHAAGVTDELVKNNFRHAVYKSNGFIKYLVDKLVKSKCKNIIYISTIHVYGNLGKIILDNSQPNPNSLYSLFHYNSEKVFKILLKKTKINFLSLRIPTIYGMPADLKKINRPNIIQFNFPLSLLKNNKIQLNTSGNQYRLFCSNLKVGKVLMKWIKDLNKNQFSEGSVHGQNITVKKFATLCIETFDHLFETSPKLIIKDSEPVNEVFSKIRIPNLYKTNEDYQIKDYFKTFFKSHVI